METLPIEILAEILLYSIDYSKLRTIKQSLRQLYICSRWRVMIKDLIPKISCVFGVDIVNPVRIMTCAPTSLIFHWNKYLFRSSGPGGCIFAVKNIETDETMTLTVETRSTLKCGNYVGFFDLRAITVYDVSLSPCKYPLPYECLSDFDEMSAQLIETSIGLMFHIYNGTKECIFLLDNGKVQVLRNAKYNLDGTECTVTRDYIAVPISYVESSALYSLYNHKTNQKYTMTTDKSINSSYGNRLSLTESYIVLEFEDMENNTNIESEVYDLSTETTVRRIRDEHLFTLNDAVIFSDRIYHMPSNSLIYLNTKLHKGMILSCYKNGLQYCIVLLYST